MYSARLFIVSLVLGLTGLVASCGSGGPIAAPDEAIPTAAPTQAPASSNDASDGDAAADTTTADAAATDVTTGQPGAAADVTSSDVPVRSRGKQPAEQGQRYSSIRDVDFMEGFTYDTGFDFGSLTATVTGGVFENGEFGDPEYFSFTARSVEFGDLNNDGTEEAIVVTSWNGGGSGHFDSVRAFRLVDGQVEFAGNVPFGDRADGGVFDTAVEDGVAYVWSFSTTLGACCPSEIRRNTLVLGDYWLALADGTAPRTWMSLNSYDTETELKFLPGTSSAMVVVYGWETEGVFTFDAAQGQRLTLALTDGPAATTISVTSLATGEVLSGLADMVLPADGFYEVSVAFDAERAETTVLDVVIDDGETVAPISWSPVVEQLLITEEPYVTTSLVWPQFSSDQPGTDAANDALASLVLGLDDLWVEDVTEFTAPLDDSSYDLRYEITLATPEVASVRFNYYEYVCCRPYPNYGPISAVLDLQAGRIIPTSEILDMNRLDEITGLWIAELEKQGLAAEFVDELLQGQPRFDSLTLHPNGVEFSTGRNTLGGGSIGTDTVVTYEQLGDLVNADLVARIRTR